MQFKNKYIGFAALLLWQNVAIAQQLPAFNQHIFNSFLYNPARAGADECRAVDPGNYGTV